MGWASLSKSRIAYARARHGLQARGPSFPNTTMPTLHSRRGGSQREEDAMTSKSMLLGPTAPA